MSKMLVVVMAILAILACGPTAPSEPTADNQPADQSDHVADSPSTDGPEEYRTQESEPTGEPSGVVGQEEAPPRSRTTPGPKPTPELKPIVAPEEEAEEPTPDEEPDPTPGYTRGPRAESDPFHPEGLEGCKRLGTFRDHANLKYLNGCADALTEHVWEICGKLADGEAQRRCGDEITQEYDSAVFRLGSIRCSGIDDEIIHRECTTASWEDFAEAQEAKIAAWERIRVAANQDPNVVDKLSATVACLEESGHRDVDGLLFHWQHGLSPSEHKEREDRLTKDEKDLREQLHEPSRECAHREGLFAAQDEAWMTEVRRLQEPESQVVAELVREGFLEALERSGEPTFITGDLPPHRNP